MRILLGLLAAEFLRYIGIDVISRVAFANLNDPTSFKLVRIDLQESPFFDQLVEIALGGSGPERAPSKPDITVDGGSGESSFRILQELEDQQLSVLPGHTVRFSRVVISPHGSDMSAVIHAYMLFLLLTCTIGCKTISGRVCLSDEHGYHWVSNWAKNRPGPAPARQPGDGHGTSMTNWTPSAGGQKAGERSTYSAQTTAATVGGER